MSMMFLKQSLFVLATIPLILPAQPAWLNDDLVAYYSFEGEAVDLSGDQRHLNFLSPAPASGTHRSFGANPTIAV